MSRYIKGVNRNQITLLPNAVDDYVSENNEVRVIDAFVNSLNLNTLGFQKATPSHVGAPSYDPKDLLKIYIYAYPKKIRSSRKLQKEIQINLELIWLVGGITPDFRTLSDFRKDNITPIKSVLKEFNKLCLELNVFSRELSSLDGSKFKAVNSKDNNFTQDKLTDRLKRLNKQSEEYLKKLETNDKEEEALSSSDKEDIKEKLKAVQERTIKYNHHLKTMLDNGDSQISLTDEESRLMKCNNNMLVGFNAQVTVDSKSHTITSITTNNKPYDNGSMFEAAEKVKEAYDVDQIEQLADGGYVDKEDIKKCFQNKIIPILPDDKYTITMDYKEHEITDEIKKGKNCKDVQECLESGVIPDCYSHLDLSTRVETVSDSTNLNAVLNTTDEIVISEKAHQGFFVRNRDKNIVLCPCGNTLTFKRKKSDTDLFIGNSKCLDCPHKCTSSNAREVEIPFNEDVAACKAFHTSLRKSFSTEEKKVVVLEYVPDKKKYKLRKNTSEHPFGTLKRTHDASYLLLKGTDKVEAELTLSALGYNIKRIIHMLGVEALLEHFKNKERRSY